MMSPKQSLLFKFSDKTFVWIFRFPIHVSCPAHLIYMTQEVNRQPLAPKAHVCVQGSPREIHGEQSSTGTHFSLSHSVFPFQYHSTVVVHAYNLCHLGDEQYAHW
jgi:hypothetical protein